jgi:hypothetical protein
VIAPDRVALSLLGRNGIRVSNSSVTMRSTPFIAASLSLLLAAPSAGQGNQSNELIPRTLVEAIFSAQNFGAGVGRSPTIVVGTLPPTVQSKIVLPGNAKVLGGITMEQMSIGIVVLEGPLNSVAESFQKDLLKNGWEVEDQGPMRFYGNEFIDAPSAQRRPIAGASDTYCGRGGTLMVKFDPDGFSQTRATITSLGFNRCSQMRDMMLRGGPGRMDRGAQRPTLVNPAGARNQQGICPNYNMGMGGQGTELNSNMTAQEIFAHYAKQLMDAGWKDAGSGHTGTWIKTDSTGTVTEYQISVRSSAASPLCRKVDAELRARTP